MVLRAKKHKVTFGDNNPTDYSRPRRGTAHVQIRIELEILCERGLNRGGCSGSDPNVEPHVVE